MALRLVVARLVARLAAIAALAAASLRPVAHAQPPVGQALRDSLRDDRTFDFHARGPYRPAVPRPEALLGYRLGDRNTQYAEQERVLLAIAAAAPDRVRVEEIGATHEGRRMRIFLVSAPENIARLDEIRRDLDRIADPRTASTAELDGAARRTPAVVWISESVHGNESPGFESGMQLLYQLAASEEPATLAALRTSVVISTPAPTPTATSASPSGTTPSRGATRQRELRARRAVERAGAVQPLPLRPQPRRHRQLAAEVQAIMRGMLRWHPQVAVDQHGHTTNYFFPPPRDPSTRTSARRARSGSRASAARTPPRSTVTGGCTTCAPTSTSTTPATGTRGPRSAGRRG
jgi:hypothetical protein